MARCLVNQAVELFLLAAPRKKVRELEEEPEVLRRAGDLPGADAALREALEVAIGKGDVVTERRIREQLAQQKSAEAIAPAPSDGQN